LDGSIWTGSPASSVGAPAAFIWRDIFSLRCTPADGSFCPRKLSMASRRSRRFCVKSCDARNNPLVTTTAAWSSGPSFSSTKRRARFFTFWLRSGAT
jgi:hypothetical protein